MSRWLNSWDWHLAMLAIEIEGFSQLPTVGTVGILANTSGRFGSHWGGLALWSLVSKFWEVLFVSSHVFAEPVVKGYLTALLPYMSNNRYQWWETQPNRADGLWRSESFNIQWSDFLFCDVDHWGRCPPKPHCFRGGCRPQTYALLPVIFLKL